MKFLLKLQCPDCEAIIRIPADDPLPKFCSACGRYTGVDEDFVPEQVNIGTAKNGVADAVYRGIERDSQNRAIAAEQDMMAAGLSQAEAASAAAQLKITNLNDNLREGDVAAKSPVKNIVTEAADALTGGSYFQASIQGEVAMAHQGPVKGSGAPAIAAIQGRSGGAPVAPPGGLMQAGWGGGVAPTRR